ALATITASTDVRDIVKLEQIAAGVILEMVQQGQMAGRAILMVGPPTPGKSHSHSMWGDITPTSVIYTQHLSL
ncbi:hypothetical protein MJO29_000294, partial [Puccinia striiformis f. sp. tritici]